MQVNYIIFIYLQLICDVPVVGGLKFSMAQTNFRNVPLGSEENLAISPSGTVLRFGLKSPNW